MTAHTADEIVEAMARAIDRHWVSRWNKADGSKRWLVYDRENGNRSGAEFFTEEAANIAAASLNARAAYAECLRQIREPTDGMIDMMEPYNDALRDLLRQRWRAMIDARLKELE